MSNKIKVNVKDKYRVLMTELLPYELPLWFSNEILYKRTKANEKFLDCITNKAKIKNFVPLDYKIRRTNGGTRILSIIHPIIQKDFCNFYDKYQDLIIYYCNRSKKSLRFPVKIVNSFFKKDIFETSNEISGIEEGEKNFLNFISFFKYNKYPFLYKFFESYDYNKLEKRFQSLVQVDISKCFHNIYTHSVSWAIKNKYIAKRDIKKGGFDQEFDRLMRMSNYSETNGILIGAEISRIFAEIILQAIDLAIIIRLELDKLKVGVDYDFRRYVDDYFVYFNNSSIKEKVVEAINLELFHYKMHLNEAKTIVSERPFITDISLCKMEISTVVEEMFKNRYFESKGSKKLSFVRNPGKKANKLISSIKKVVKKHGVKYSSICNYMMSVFSRRIFDLISSFRIGNVDKDAEERLVPWLLIDIDILYFLHAMDPRIVSTDKTVRIILEIMNLKQILSADGYYLIQKKIFDANVESIRLFRTSSTTPYSVEQMNILLLLSKLKDQFKLDESFIKEFFNLENANKIAIDEPFYFLWSSLMLYIKNDQQYDSIRNDLNNKAKEFFYKNPHKFGSTEFFLFWGDFLACPYVNHADKQEIVRAATCLKNEKSITKYIEKHFKNNKGLIIDWHENEWLAKGIKKKVFKYAYE